MGESIVRNLLTAFLTVTTAAGTQAQDSVSAAVVDTMRTIHRLEAEVVDGAVFHTHDFLKGYNPEVRTMNQYFTVKAKYAFMPPAGSRQARIYKGVYQGVGLAYHHLNPQIGNPVSAYLFQGATIATLSRRLSFNYEWDFGVTYGWKAYDDVERQDNRVIGSKMTAYMDANFYLRWMLSPQWDINFGLSASHFSNGNTALPNAGLNVASLKLSAAYYLNRPADEPAAGPLPPFQHYWTTDVVLFAGWKRRGTETDFGTLTLPGVYGVAGVNVNPMYHVNHWLNLGGSLDMYYDHSANLIIGDSKSSSGGKDSSEEPKESSFGDNVSNPRWTKQVTAGISARGEFVMPYFTINFGVGHNFINAGSGNFKGFYEVLALKVALSQKTFLHIGYSLYDFQHPNNLMLGVGYRFGSPRN
ncbi:MAG: acyloxyacyl hydrolase [Prevotella sp.]|nr:acyloxyacyl hydrolase [Prevotella sp.]